MNSLISQNERRDGRSDVISFFSRYLEFFIIGTLSVSMTAIYFDLPRWTRAFGEAGLVALLVWSLFHKRKPVNLIPHFLIIMSVLYILSYVINDFMSPDPNWEHVNIRKYIYIIIGGLLFAFPVKAKYRQFMIVTFFSSAAIAGAYGIYQYFKGGIGSSAQGFSNNPLHYAGVLALVCSTAVVMLFIRNRNLFGSKRGALFLSMVAILTFMGILFSHARGVWVALFVAIALTLILYDRRKALFFIMSLIPVLAIFFYFSIDLRDRAISIVTYGYTIDDEKSSAGNRIELWKGALLIFKEAQLWGVGTGNFELSFNKLVHDKKLKEVPAAMHAHNIYFQALATRGIVGFIATIGLFISLILWGVAEIRNHVHIGGHIIILSTVLTMVSGLTENNIEFTKFLASYCFTIGLLGPLGVMKNSDEIIALH